MAYKKVSKTIEQLQNENSMLKERLKKAEEALHSLHSGDMPPEFMEAFLQTKAEGELKSKKLIQCILDNVNSGVALIDEMGRFLICNPLFLKLFGLAENETIKNVNDQDWSLWQVFNEQGILLNVDDHPVRKAAMTGKRVDQQLVGVKLPSGVDTIWMLVSAEPLFKDNGDIENIICTYTDITRRRKTEQLLKESEERFKLALRNAPVSVAIQDKNLVYTWAYNQKTRSIDDIVGKTDADLFTPEDLKWINPIKKSILKSGKESNVEKWITSNGRRLFLGIHYEPIFDTSGAIIGIGAATIDMTNRKLAEESLAFKSNLLSNVNDAVFSSDNTFTISYWNFAAEKMFGWTNEEALGRNSGELLKPKIEGSALDHERSKLKSNGRWEGEVQYLRKDGTYFFAEVNSTVLRDENGKDTGNVIVVRDVTQNKLTAEELKKSEKLYRAIGESIDYGIWICDAEGKNIYASESYLKLVGITQEQCSEFGWGDTLHHDDAERTMEAWKECSKNGTFWDIEHRFKGVDGKWHPILARGIPIRDDTGKITMWAGINLDINKFKNTENALRESEERLRVTLSSIGDAVLSVDTSGRIVFLNPVAVNLLGWELEEAQGRKALEVFRIINEITLEPVTDIVQQVLLEGEVIELTNHTALVTRDGRHIPIEDSAAPIKDQEGNVIGAVLVFHDVCEKRKAEKALKTSLIKYKTLFDCLPLGITISDEQGNIIESNQASEPLLGLTKEDQELRRIYGQEWQLITPEGAPMPPDDYASVRALKENRLVENVEMGLVRPDNSTTWINVTAVPIPLEGYGVLIIYTDITGRKKMEGRLRESEERFRNLVKSAPTAIYEIDFHTMKFTSVNDSMCKLSGYTREELCSINPLDILIDDSKKVFLSRISKFKSGQIVDDSVEYKVKSKDGRIIDAVLNMKFNFNEKGDLLGATVVGFDITERKKVTEELLKLTDALKDREERLKSVLNATLESIYMFDTKGIICMVNSTGVKRLKLNSESEIIGHHFSEFMSPEVSNKRVAMHQEVIITGKPRQFEDERDSRTYYHSFYPVLIDDKVQFVVTHSTDITERKNAELKLKQSEDRLRSIAESLTVMISITRVEDSVTLFANEPYFKAFGFRPEDILGKKDPDIYVFPEDRNTIQDKLNELEIINNKELKVKKFDGSHFWIITSIRKITYQGYTSYLASSIDITETKRTQEELIRLNRTLNAHSKSSQAMLHSNNEFSYLNEVCKIIIKDCGHSMVWVGYAQNDEKKTVSPVAYYGFDKGYIDQMNITWDDSEHGRGPTGTAIKTCRPSICKNMLTDSRFAPWREAAIDRGFASSLVLPLMADGKAFGAVSIYSKEPDSFSDSEIDLLNDLVDDLSHGISYIRLTESERAAARVIKENEAKLKELVVTKDKFFNIIAHDLKNPFTSLLGSSELLYDNISQMSTENVRNLALILNDSAKGGYAILQNLLDWSRSQTGLINFYLREENLRAIIDENIENFNLQTSNKEITMKSDLKTDLNILADRNMINTVLRNMLSNAVKFTNKKGYVTVSTELQKDEIIMSVSDTGVGMSQNKIDQLFKLENTPSMPGTEKEQGTGLGLKLCKEFTEMMGGRIWVESEPGKGSRFSFTIPIKAKSTRLRAQGTGK